MHKIKNRDEIHQHESIGEKIADQVANGMGSWNFIIIQSIIVLLWIMLNSFAFFIWKWDAPPFILLNLIFSTQASYAAPIIMMSQNRQANKDRKRDDLESNEVEQIYQSHRLLLQINQQQLEILQLLQESTTK